MGWSVLNVLDGDCEGQLMNGKEAAPKSLLDGPVKHRPGWPFLHYQQGRRFYVNKAPRKKPEDAAAEVGEARW
jgi:hypothetical protein